MSIKSDVQKDYFRWLCELVSVPYKYAILTSKLHDTAYIWVIDRDSNRVSYGKSLRRLYAISKEFDADEISWVEACLAGPCSVLELMIALAKQIEEDIMYDPDHDDRTSEWFMDMVGNLGLSRYDDDHYEEKEVDYILNRFMSRNYNENGDGNLFKNVGPVDKKVGQTFKNQELWVQANQYYVKKYGI